MKNKKCRICQKEQKNDDDKYIIIKEKILYDTDDGFWYNFTTAAICWDCIKKVKEMVKSS